MGGSLLPQPALCPGGSARPPLPSLPFLCHPWALLPQEHQDGRGSQPEVPIACHATAGCGSASRHGAVRHPLCQWGRVTLWAPLLPPGRGRAAPGSSGASRAGMGQVSPRTHLAQAVQLLRPCHVCLLQRLSFYRALLAQSRCQRLQSRQHNAPTGIVLLIPGDFSSSSPWSELHSWGKKKK